MQQLQSLSDNKITDEFIHPFDNSESAFTDYVLESAKKSFLIGVKICWSKDFGNYEVLDGSVSTWSLNNDNNCSFILSTKPLSFLVLIIYFPDKFSICIQNKILNKISFPVLKIYEMLLYIFVIN